VRNLDSEFPNFVAVRLPLGLVILLLTKSGLFAIQYPVYQEMTVLGWWVIVNFPLIGSVED
jgi:hypothetical protein